MSALRFIQKNRSKRYEACSDVAEGVGFEPTVPCGITGFQDQLLKPLGHPSNAEQYSIKQALIQGTHTFLISNIA